MARCIVSYRIEYRYNSRSNDSIFRGVTNYHIGPHRTPLVRYEAPRNLPQQ